MSNSEVIEKFLNNIQLSNVNQKYPNVNLAAIRLIQIFDNFSFLLSDSSISSTYYDLSNPTPLTNEVEFYALGVDIYYKGTAISDTSYFDAAIPIFAICAGLNNGYHQAYNRIGDCLIRINRFERALNFFRTSLYYIEQGSHLGYIPVDTYIGDNYFKISLCLHKLNRDKDKIKVFITEAQSLAGDDYGELPFWGYKSWEEVFNNLLAEYKLITKVFDMTGKNTSEMWLHLKTIVDGTKTKESKDNLRDNFFSSIDYALETGRYCIYIIEAYINDFSGIIMEEIIYRDCYNMLKNENDIDSFEEYKTIIGNAIDYIRER